MMQPFIFLGPWKALEKMRGLGFKTFSPFIDESYDDVEDDDQRFELIVQEINRLCNLTGEDWQIWQAGIKEIVEYNHRFFHENRNFVYSENYLEHFTDLTPGEYVAEVVNQPVVEEVERERVEHDFMCECFACRVKSIKVAYCGIGGGDATAQRQWDRNLDLYRKARAEGIQPTGTSRSKVVAAMKQSDRTGKAFVAE